MSRLGRILVMANRRTVTPATPVFATPVPIAVATSSTTTDTAVITNSIAVTAGQRLVLPFAHTRGSVGTPASGIRTLSSVVGAGDFVGVTDASFTTQATVAQQIDANVAGVRIYIMSWVATLSGTGTFQVNWSNAAWSQLIQPFVLPACSVIGGFTAGKPSVGAVTTASPTLSGYGANDLAIAIISQNSDTEFTNPAGWTGEGSLFDLNQGHRIAWKNGTLADSPVWAGFRDVAAGAVAVAVYRRT